MGENIRATTVLAMTIGTMVPWAASADDQRYRIAVPVTVDFGDSNPIPDALKSAVFDKLMKSRLVTPNVDSYRALRAEVRLTRVRRDGTLAEVTYRWDRTIVGRMIYPCGRAQIWQCSTAIVSRAERASHIVRQSPSWLR